MVSIQRFIWGWEVGENIRQSREALLFLRIHAWVIPIPTLHCCGWKWDLPFICFLFPLVLVSLTRRMYTFFEFSFFSWSTLSSCLRFNPLFLPFFFILFFSTSLWSYLSNTIFVINISSNYSLIPLSFISPLPSTSNFSNITCFFHLRLRSSEC